MSFDPHSPAEPEADGRQLSTAAVAARLDQLWRARPEVDAPQVEEAPAAGASLVGAGGEQVGQYRLEQVIGSGSFGVVYLASDLQLNRRAAVKIPRPEVASDRQRRQRFENEGCGGYSKNEW